MTEKLGVFGYDRQTSLRDITDGASNTILMAQVPPTVKRPWMAGGGSTVEGVPETGSVKPFVSRSGAKPANERHHGPDGGRSRPLRFRVGPRRSIQSSGNHPRW